MALQAQWSIDRTATDIVSVGIGILRAATSDNVQPLAILACEKFGNTLAMCQETILKIEHSVVPAPEPATLKFLKSSVGYFAGDTVSQLGQSAAGALRPRCLQSGFTDNLSGWSLYLHNHTSGGLGGSPSVPTNEGICALVDALRQLQRVGADDISSVTVELHDGYCLPWTVSFIKWSLGLPPSVFWDNGRSILSQEGSQVLVILSSPPDDGEFAFKVTTHSRIRGPSELIHTSTKNSPDHPNNSYMLSIKKFGEMSKFHWFEDDLSRRAAEQVIPYAIDQVLNNIITCTLNDAQIKAFEGVNISDRRPKAVLPCPFPGKAAINRIYRLLFGKDLQLKKLEDGLRIGDLPLARSYLESDTKVEVADHPGIEEFVVRVGILVSDILSLSLFDLPEPLLVLWDRPRIDTDEGFRGAVCAILQTGVPTRCTNLDILESTLQLVGHDETPNSHPRWVASSYHGQAVWPTFFESRRYQATGYLQLSWAPGFLVHKKDTYQNAGFWSTNSSEGYERPNFSKEPVIGPRNLFPKLQPEWDVSVLDDKTLKVSLSVRNKPTFWYGHIHHSPYRLIQGMASSVFIQNCGHDPNAMLKQAERFSLFTGPIQPFVPGSVNPDGFRMPKGGKSWSHYALAIFEHERMSEALNLGDMTMVVAVDKSDDLRFFALSSIRNVHVYRGETCLKCCLDLCRKMDVKVLIL
ncbi:unnamed protein product [Clonostachys rosea]|uniref:Dehydrogenase (DH) domain-containing protein n=1 Tax=Bionectria ochroleuca TaxID=29856 RepID=A0ABY6V1J3_BIOOC|nr:unnamed protein product [Clonostachys rosea]